MLSLGHCRQILASEKQESIATVSMKKKPPFHFILIPLVVFLFSQSLILGLQALAVNCCVV